MSTRDRPDSEDEIEVTPEMVEAGLEVVSLWGPGDRRDWMVIELFRAMESARLR